MVNVHQKPLVDIPAQDPEKSTVTVRSYRPGDEKQILELWKNIFQRERTLIHWNWKFNNNPYSNIQTSLAIASDNSQIIGQYAVIPVKLNFRGVPVLAAQVVDLMTHPDFRRQGISLKMAKHCFEQLIKNNFALVFSFFSKTSYPGHVSRLDFKPITPLKQYWLRLNLSYGKVLNLLYGLWLNTKLMKERYVLKHWPDNMTFRLTKHLTFRHSKTVPDNYNVLWESMRPYEVLSLWKDSEYFAWRYDQNPDHEFDYFYLLNGNEIIGLSAVLASSNKDVTICELLVKDRNVLNGRFLINKIVSYYIKKGYRKIRFIGTDAGFFDEVFKKFHSEFWFGIVFCVKTLSNLKLQEYFTPSSNWTLSFGDIDLV